MATLRRRKNNWQAIIRLKNYPSIYKSFKQLKDAKRWASETELNIQREDAGIFYHQYPSFKFILNKYLNEVSIKKKTYRDERYTILKLLKEAWVHYSINRISPKIIAEYRDLSLKKVSGNTVNRRLDVISSIFTTCKKEWGYPVLNPISSIKRPKRGEPRNRVLNKYEIEKILSDNTLDINFRSIILIALETGMRKSEILSIKEEHIDGDLLKIPVAKVRGRIIPLTKKAKSILLNSELPFKINKYTLGNKWRKLMKKHQIKGVCFHDLRHTALTNLFLDKSLSVPEVMLISGHSDPRILLRTYTNLKVQDLVEKIG